MQACLFDHDGTLANSEVTFTRAMQAGFRDVLNRQLTAEEYIEHCVGVSVEDWQAYLSENCGGDPVLTGRLWQSIEAHCQEEFKGGVPLFEGTIPTLTLLRDAGRPAALVTNSKRNHLESMHVGRRFLDWFGSIVTPDRTSKPKPAPEMYELAARELGVNPTECWAFEDSRPGAQAAVDAGCRTYALINGHNAHVTFPAGCISLPLEQLPLLIEKGLA